MVIDFEVTQQEETEPLGMFLRKRGVSFALVKRLKFLEGGILVDGERQNTNYRLKQGQKVEIDVQDRPDEVAKSVVVPQDIPMNIAYMDNFCMVVDKPYGMSIHPCMEHGVNTLANAFCGYWQKRGTLKTYRALNRLDKNTSGLVMIALDAFSANALKNGVKKEYMAIVEGKIFPLNGSIEANIARTEGSIITRCVNENGQYARTDYTVIKQNEKLSFLKISLKTGRTHQIRVHFSHLGYPLAGDDMYGGRTDIIARHALHCSDMSFTSLETGTSITIKSQLPQDMADIVFKI